MTESGLRVCSAMFSAAGTRSAVMSSPMDQPTALRLKASSTTARYRNPVQPGRSLFQYAALLLHLAQLPAQAHQLLALGCGQAFFARERLAAIAAVLRDPVGNALRRRTELTR